MADNRWPKDLLEWMPPGEKEGQKTARQMKGNRNALAERAAENAWRRMTILDQMSVMLTEPCINIHTYSTETILVHVTET
jgi:hypothetical protein